MPVLSLRPETPDDRDFVRRLYGSTREAELELTDWSSDQKAAFVDQQFAAQHAYYRDYYPEASYDLVLADGVPAGRLYVQRSPAEIRLVDITLAPEYRDRGLGGELLAGLLSEARATGCTVTIHVEIFNPALRFYTRLGFRPIAERGPYRLMEWRSETTVEEPPPVAP